MFLSRETMTLYNRFQANLPERICGVSVFLYDCIHILWYPDKDQLSFTFTVVLATYSRSSALEVHLSCSVVETAE